MSENKTGLVIPINALSDPEKQYLNLVIVDDKALVRPGRDGHWLPKHWQIWVRDLVFQFASRKRIADVRYAGKFVYVSSPQGPDKALALAKVAAEHVYELPACPLRRVTDRRVPRNRAEWRVPLPQGTDPHDVEALLDHIDHVRSLAEQVQVFDNNRVVVERGFTTRFSSECALVSLYTTNRLSLAEQARMFELRYNLAHSQQLAVAVVPVN